MGALNISDKTLKKYFAFLNKLDDSSKSRLIERLKKSISKPQKGVLTMKDLYGKWEDPLPVEKQIKQIRNSRIDRTSEVGFE